MKDEKFGWLEKCYTVLSFAALMSLGLPGTTVQAKGNESGEAGSFRELSIRIETNATDGDAEVVIVAKNGVGLKELKLRAPNGKTPLSLISKTAPQLGQAQVLVESAEPSLDEIKTAYPAGIYEFKGKTVDGEELEGEVTLSHALLPAPVITTPSNEATGVPVNGLVVTWPAVAGATGYFFELKDEESGAALKVDLSASVTSFPIADGLLQPDTDYEISLGAIEMNGNRTFVQIVFHTAL